MCVPGTCKDKKASTPLELELLMVMRYLPCEFWEPCHSARATEHWYSL